MQTDSNRVSLVSVVFAKDGLPSFSGLAALVPKPGDDPAFSSRDTGEAIDPLPPVDLPSVCMVGVPVYSVPAGGRLSLFVAQ